MKLLSDDEFLGGSAAGGSTLLSDDQFMGGAAQPAQRSAAPTGEFKGLIESGNIDLAKRPVVKNADGSVSTVRSISFEEDGKEILIPTVSPDGKILSDKAAIDLYRKTGNHLGKFDNADDATAYAKALHGAQADFYTGKAPASGGILSDDEFLGGAPAAKPTTDGGSFLPEVGKGVVAGAVSATASGIKGAAGQNAALLQSRIDNAKARLSVMDLIDAGKPVPAQFGDDLLGIQGEVYLHASPEDRKGLRESQQRVIDTATQPGDVTQTPLYKAGQSVQNWSDEQFKAAKDYQNTWTRAISEGLGSTLPFLATRGGTGIVVGASMSAGQQLDDAIQHGATKDQIIQAIRLGGLPGMTEEAPIDLLFERIPFAKYGKMADVLGNIFAQAMAEGGQEGLQQVAQNLIAKYVYNPNQDISEGVAQSAAIGGIVGAGMKAAEPHTYKGEQEQAAPLTGQSVPQGAASADTLFGQESAGGPPPPSADTAAGGPPPPPAATPEKERPNSPRLTPADRASPLPNDLIDDGKKIFDEALGAGKSKTAAPLDGQIITPAQQKEAARRVDDIAGEFGTPSGQTAPPALERTIDGVATAAEAPSAPAATPARLLTDEQFMTSPVANIAGPDVEGGMTQFKPESGTLNVPRSEMPQIKAEHRGAMVNFLAARGIEHQSETIPAGDLKPTQAEFSREKVEKAKSFGGGDRSILVSSDGYVLDGHHQWLAKLDAQQPVDVIRLDAPMKQLLPVVSEFPSATTAPAEPDAPAPVDVKQPRSPSVENKDIVQFIAGMGGIRDYKGELRSMDLSKKFVPGMGKLVRESGSPADTVREAAAQEGYFDHIYGDPDTASQKSTVADLYRLIDDNERGNRRFTTSGQRAVEKKQADKAVVQDSEEQARQDDFAQTVKENGLDDEETAILQDAVDRGEWASEAVFDILERRAVAFEGETHDIRGQGEPNLDDIPFDIPQAPDTRAADAPREGSSDQGRDRQGADAGAAQGSAPPRGQHGQAERSGRSEEGGKGQGALKTETVDTQDGKREQTVIPGAERISQKTQAQREADKPLRPKAPQKDAGELFDSQARSERQDDMFSAKPPEPAPQQALKEKIQAKRAEAATAKIDDFGEKIAGARKDMVRDLADSLSSDIDIATEPLSKIFPQPDYEKLAEAGVNPRSLALIAAARETIPAKPRKGYKVARWAEQVRTLRKFANMLLSGEFSNPDAITEKMRGSAFLMGLADTATVLEGIDPAMLPQAAKWRVRSGSYSAFGGDRFDRPQTKYTLIDDKGRMAMGSDRKPVSADTLEGITDIARSLIRAAITGKDETGARKMTPTAIYQDRTTKTFFIGFKGQSGVIRLKAGFNTAQDARSYREEKAGELQAAIDEMRAGPQMRRPENRPREGVDRREGDVSPEQFQEAFGFRGVQFGNYVEGPRRQFELNEAFDGLMDLAEVIGVPPKALSLNGKLGLAFGARGHGNAKAHYEPSHVVINLTKPAGAGSLAHEWFHAVDDYFARQDTGRDKGSVDFMTTRGDSSTGAVRPAVRQAFNSVRKSLTGGAYSARMQKLDDARSKIYWNTMIEKAARGFEKYVVDRLAAQKATNDYLANIDENAGAYPTNAEMRDQGITAAFDDLFNAIETRDTPQGVELFKLRPTDAFAARAQDVGKRLRAELDRLGLKDVGLRIAENLGLMVDGKLHPADGAYFRKLISVALDADNPDSVLDHEAIHALRDVGAFSPDEWAILERKSRKEWRDRYGIADAYGSFPDGVQIEEGIAHAYADWRAGRSMDGIIAKAFKKIRGILQAIGRAFGKDFRTAEDVFGQVASGEIGNQRDASANPVGAGGQPMFQSAWHGTPHDFDQFSLDHIGKGEGAQAYGWGLYFAGKKQIAEYYREKLAGREDRNVVTIDGREAVHIDGQDWVWNEAGSPEPNSAETAALNFFRFHATPKEAATTVRNYIEDADQNGGSITLGQRAYTSQDLRGALAILEGNIKASKPGRLFKVDLPEDSEMLDWDKPISEQPEGLLEKIDRAMSNLEPGLNFEVMNDRSEAVDELTFSQMYKRLQDGRYDEEGDGFSDKQISEALRAAGIPGHKYLDNTSRTSKSDAQLQQQLDDVTRRIENAQKDHGFMPATAQAESQAHIDALTRERDALQRKLDKTYNYVIYDDSRINVEERFKLRSEPQSAEDRQKTMQGFIARGQPLDRALRLPFQFFGGVDEKGRWKPGLHLSDKAAKIITTAKIDPQGRFGWLAGPIEAARAGLIDRYGLSPEYIDRDRQRQMDERSITMRGAEVLKTLAEQNVGTNEARVLQAILTGEAVSDKDMNDLAAPIRQAIDELGQEAVSLGLVSAESFERNRGAYLHRVYAKHEAEQNNLQKLVSQVMGRKRKQIIGDELKGRGLFWDVDNARLMRDIASFKEGKRGGPVLGEKFHVLDNVLSPTKDMLSGEERGKVARRVYVPADQAVPAQYTGPEWRDNGVWEVRKAGKDKVTLWRDYSQAERTKMGEILDARYTIGKTYLYMAHDLATGRFYKDIAQNEEWTSSAEPADGTWTNPKTFGRAGGYGDFQWVRVPDEPIPGTGGKKKWGALAGKFVRAEIWRDLNEINVMNRPSTWHMLLSQWKLNHTARSPQTHMNNVMSNLMFMDMQDVRMQDLQAGIRSFINKDKHWQDANAHGVFGSDMMTQEIRDKVLKPILAEIEKQGQEGVQNSFLARAGILGKFADRLFGLAKTVDRKMIDLYRAEDDVFRLASYRAGIARGESPEHAAAAARERFLDYDIRAPWVNAARNSLLPFISYTYRAVPLIARAMATRPWKMAKYAMIAYALNALAYAWDDDGDEDKERASLNDQEQGNTWMGTPRMMRMPWRNKDGMPVFLDVRRWIPAGDVFDTNQGQSVIPIPAPLQFGGPMMLGAELALNKSAFTGDPIRNDLTDNWWDTTGKTADYLWKAWMPSAAWVPNSWYWTKIENAAKGATDIKGHPYSLPEAISSSFGVKVKPQDVETGLFWHYKDIKDVEQALRAEARTLARQRDRGLISQKAFDAGMQSLLSKRDRLIDRVKELQRVQKK